MTRLTIKKPAAKRPAEKAEDYTPAFKAKLAESGLTAAHAKILGLTLEAATPDRVFSVPGILIPYFDLSGKPLKDFWRYRLLKDLRSGFDKLTKKKQLRYTQPKHASPRAYFAPTLPWARIAKDPKVLIIVTEGELKAACGCSVAKLPTIGLGGVWNFTESVGYSRELLPDLEAIDWTDRPVIVLYDSDAASNDQVRKAEFRIADMLNAAGAAVKVGRLPALPDGKKCGLDDYVMTCGVDALREVLDAAEGFAELEDLRRLNLELAVVLNPDVCYVKYAAGRYLEGVDPGTPRAKRSMIELMAPHKSIIPVSDGKGGTTNRQTPLFQRWAEWPGRTTVRAMDYAPGEAALNADLYNLWSGWGVEPVTDEQLNGAPPDVKPWHDLLDLLFQDAPREQRDWFERWCAYPIRYPGTKLLSCVILASRAHGVGKSFLGEILGRIYGRAGDPTMAGCLNSTTHVNAGKVDLMSLTSGRNTWARARQFVVGDDVRGTTSAETREIRDQLKDAVTRQTFRVDEKYQVPVELRDCCNMMFSTNEPEVFQMDEGDRRFFVFESTAAPESAEFYARVDRWSKSHGPSHLHRYFLEMDLGDFDARARPPVTEAKVGVVEASSSWLDFWARSLKDSPDLILQKDSVPLGFKLYSAEELLEVYVANNATNPDAARTTFTALGWALRRAGIAKRSGCSVPGKGQRILYAPGGFEGLPPGLKDLGTFYLTERDMAKTKKATTGRGAKLSGAQQPPTAAKAGK